MTEREEKGIAGNGQEEKELGKWRKRILSILTHESDTEESEELTLRNIVKALDGVWLMRQMPLLGIIAVFLIVMTTLHYQWQKDLIEKEELKRRIEDITYRSAALNSELTEKTRQSMIERRLRSNGDSTLMPSTEAPFVVRTSQREEE